VIGWIDKHIAVVAKLQNFRSLWLTLTVQHWFKIQLCMLLKNNCHLEWYSLHLYLFGHRIVTAELNHRASNLLHHGELLYHLFLHDCVIICKTVDWWQLSFIYDFQCGSKLLSKRGIKILCTISYNITVDCLKLINIYYYIIMQEFGLISFTSVSAW